MTDSKVEKFWKDGIIFVLSIQQIKLFTNPFISMELAHPRDKICCADENVEFYQELT